MRSKRTRSALISACLVLLAGFVWLRKVSEDSFAREVTRAREALADEVSAPGDGVSFFTRSTLTPTWDESGATPLAVIPPFRLTSAEGETKTEKMFDGRLTLVAFFFTSCRGFCPTFLEALKKIDHELAAVAEMQYVAITVDPEKDDVPTLARYQKNLDLAGNPRWTFLTGDRGTIYSLAKDSLGAEAFRRKAKPDIVHSEHFYLIDGRGRLRGVLNGTRLDVADSARALLAGLRAGKV